jgi:hypothetical protein
VISWGWVRWNAILATEEQQQQAEVSERDHGAEKAAQDEGLEMQIIGHGCVLGLFA